MYAVAYDHFQLPTGNAFHRQLTVVARSTRIVLEFGDRCVKFAETPTIISLAVNIKTTQLIRVHFIISACVSVYYLFVIYEHINSAALSINRLHCSSLFTLSALNALTFAVVSGSGGVYHYYVLCTEHKTSSWTVLCLHTQGRSL